MAKTVIDQFKRMLRVKFITSPKCKTIDYFREELLEVLMEKYNEYIQAGYDSKTAVKLSYKILAEFKDAIREIRKQVLNENKSKRLRQYAIFTLTYSIAVVFGYLVYSVFSKNWATSWYIIVGGTFVYLIGAFACSFYINRAKNKRIWTSISIWGTFMLSATALYLISGFGFGLWHPMWIIFIGGAFVSYLLDFIHLWHNKHRVAKKIDIVIISILATVIAYLSISFATRVWNTTWLIFVGFLFVLMVVVLIDVIFSDRDKR